MHTDHKRKDRKQYVLSHFSRRVLLAGCLLMLGYYITAAFAIAIYPYATNRSGNTAVKNGCLQAAPASLATGVTAALLCDVIIKRNGLQDIGEKKEKEKKN